MSHPGVLLGSGVMPSKHYNRPLDFRNSLVQSLRQIPHDYHDIEAQDDRAGLRVDYAYLAVRLEGGRSRSPISRDSACPMGRPPPLCPCLSCCGNTAA
jgi:hypothetical protein